MSKVLLSFSWLALLSIFFAQHAWGVEANGRYVTLQYSDNRLLREFNDKLIIGRKLTSMIQKNNVETVEDEVVA